MKKNNLKDAYEIIGNGILLDLKNGNANNLINYHFNRLLSCGISESDAAQMLGLIEIGIMTAREIGDYEKVEQMQLLYDELPEIDPRNSIH